MINEYELSVLLGVRNCLDRFTEMIWLAQKTTSILNLSYTTEESVLYNQIAGIRQNLQGIIESYEEGTEDDDTTTVH